MFCFCPHPSPHLQWNCHHPLPDRIEFQDHIGFLRQMTKCYSHHNDNSLVSFGIGESTRSEEIAHPTVYNHLTQVSVDNQMSGLAKCREDSDGQMPLRQVVFCSLAWIYLSPLS